jgi:hypothetical protein
VSIKKAACFCYVSYGLCLITDLESQTTLNFIDCEVLELRGLEAALFEITELSGKAHGLEFMDFLNKNEDFAFSTTSSYSSFVPIKLYK